MHAFRCGCGCRGTHYDCGSREGYVQAALELALALRDAGLASAVRGVLGVTEQVTN